MGKPENFAAKYPKHLRLENVDMFWWKAFLLMREIFVYLYKVASSKQCLFVYLAEKRTQILSIIVVSINTVKNTVSFYMYVKIYQVITQVYHNN